MNKRRFIKDILLNLIATGLPLLLLQLVAMPYVSKMIGVTQYGLVVTIVSLLNTVPGTLGNALNNIRLLWNERYRQENLEGDFNPLLLSCMVISLAIVFGAASWYEKAVNQSVFFTTLLSLFWLAREYLVVTFRIDLNYQRMVISNIILTAGYAVGFLVFIYLYPAWQLIYLLGYLPSLLYIASFSNLWREKCKTTSLFIPVLRDSIMISVGGFLGRATTYAEKLLLFPMLGGSAVSIYFASSIFGKIISMGISPITSVLLSYLAKIEHKPTKVFKIMLLIVGFAGLIGYGTILVISGPALRLLYPEFAAEAAVLVPLTAIATILTIFISVVNAFILRFQRMQWQIYINLISSVVLVIASLTLTQHFGLRGFCVALIIVDIVKLGISLFVFMQKKKNEGFADTLCMNGQSDIV